MRQHAIVAHLDGTAGTLYCFDESYGRGIFSSFGVGSETSQLTGQASTAGNDVHGWLYGGIQTAGAS